MSHENRRQCRGSGPLGPPRANRPGKTREIRTAGAAAPQEIKEFEPEICVSLERGANRRTKMPCFCVVPPAGPAVTLGPAHIWVSKPPCFWGVLPENRANGTGTGKKTHRKSRAAAAVHPCSEVIRTCQVLERRPNYWTGSRHGCSAAAGLPVGPSARGAPAFRKHSCCGGSPRGLAVQK